MVATSSLLPPIDAAHIPKELEVTKAKKQRVTIYRLINAIEPIDALNEQLKEELQRLNQSETAAHKTDQNRRNSDRSNLQTHEQTFGGYNIYAICKSTTERPPKWLHTINSISGSQFKVKNRQSGAILFIQPNNGLAKDNSAQPTELWAVTFGAGHTWIDNTKVDDLYGVRIAIRLHKSQEIRSINTNALESKPKQVRTTTPTGSEINEFAFDEFRDFLTRIDLSGGLEKGGDQLKIRATDSINIPLEPDAKSICRVIDQLQDILNREPSSKLAHLENLRPERNKDKIKMLDSQLVNALQDDKQASPIGFMYPHSTFDSEGEPTHFKLISIPRNFTPKTPNRKKIFPPNDIFDLLGPLLKSETTNGSSSISAKQLAALLNHVKVQLFNDAGKMGRPVKLRDWLTNEQTVKDDPNHRYYLLNGNWFKLENSYIQQIVSELSKIINDSDTLDPIPEWNRDIRDEGEYNALLAEAQDGLLLDKNLITSTEYHLRLEACDVLVKGGNFIHVKLTDSSAAASHLVLQALNSAELLSYDTDTQKKLEDKITELCQATEDKDRNDFTHIPNTVTLVLAKSNATMTEHSLYMFTKVSIVRAFKTLSRIGIKLNVCFIKRETDDH